MCSGRMAALANTSARTSRISNPCGGSNLSSPALGLSVLGCVSDCGLCCCQSCDRNSEGAAADVVQAQLVAEVDGVRVSPMLSADPDLHLGSRLAAFGNRHRHQASHAVLVDRLERVAGQDLVFEVTHDEMPLRVVAGV